MISVCHRMSQMSPKVDSVTASHFADEETEAERS